MPSRGALGSQWLAALLTAVVVGLAVFVGFQTYDAVAPAGAAPAESRRVLGTDERAELLSQAADLSQRVLTYHYDRFDRELEATSGRLAPKFRREYVNAMENVRANTVKNKVSQKATAVSAAVISASQDEARVLVFVNQETSSARTKADQLVRNRLVLELVRVDGEWAVAGLKALD